jgi:hypothetical protein
MESNRRITQMVHMNVAHMPTKEVHDDRTAEADDKPCAKPFGAVAPDEANAPMKHATTPYTQLLDPSILSIAGLRVTASKLKRALPIGEPTSLSSGVRIASIPASQPVHATRSPLLIVVGVSGLVSWCRRLREQLPVVPIQLPRRSIVAKQTPTIYAIPRPIYIPQLTTDRGIDDGVFCGSQAK